MLSTGANTAFILVALGLIYYHWNWWLCVYELTGSQFSYLLEEVFSTILFYIYFLFIIDHHQYLISSSYYQSSSPSDFQQLGFLHLFLLIIDSKSERKLCRKSLRCYPYLWLGYDDMIMLFVVELCVMIQPGLNQLIIFSS